MSISSRDKEVVWHPYTQASLEGLPLAITSGKGSLLFDEDGKSYIDAISSWWVNLHGHAHPTITEKITEQLNKLHHVMFAGFTHEPAVTLAERLLSILPQNLSKVFYSDNGSTAVEVALKMAKQYWTNVSKPRVNFVAFEGSYHGDTFGAMSSSARGSYALQFEDMLFDVTFVPLPIDDSAQNTLEALSKLEKMDIAAFIYEPLLQGAGGMKMYSKAGLSKILKWFKKKDVLLIADEVFTGFGRTGELFASSTLQVCPDIICLSKGLTGGTIALGVTAASEEIFKAFLSDDRAKMLFHGHSFTANALACTASLASLDLLLLDECQKSRARISKAHNKFAESLRSKKQIENVRQLGTVLALDIKTKNSNSYLSPVRDRLYNYFIEEGVLLRPLGNIVYILPPYCITDEELKKVYSCIGRAIEECEL